MTVEIILLESQLHWGLAFTSVNCYLGIN